MFNSDFINKFFGTTGLGEMFNSILNEDDSMEKELDEIKKDGEYKEETIEKDGKIIKTESWQGNDGSFYKSRVVTYGKGLHPPKENNLLKLETDLKEAIDGQEFEKCAEIRDEIAKLKEKEGE